MTKRDKTEKSTVYRVNSIGNIKFRIGYYLKNRETRSSKLQDLMKPYSR